MTDFLKIAKSKVVHFAHICAYGVETVKTGMLDYPLFNNTKFETGMLDSVVKQTNLISWITDPAGLLFIECKKISFGCGFGCDILVGVVLS